MRLVPVNVTMPFVVSCRLSHLYRLLAPSSVTDSDAADVYAAGWSEKALFHTIAVTGIFNLMNRLVEGTGITADPVRRNASRDRMANERDNPRPYAEFARMVKTASESGILGDSMTGSGWEDDSLSLTQGSPIPPSSS